MMAETMLLPLLQSRTRKQGEQVGCMGVTLEKVNRQKNKKAASEKLPKEKSQNTGCAVQ